MTNQELRQKSLELCWAIEELPASEQQTKISLMASGLSRQLDLLVRQTSDPSASDENGGISEFCDKIYRVISEETTPNDFGNVNLAIEDIIDIAQKVETVALHEFGNLKYKHVIDQREKYLEAFIAETGAKPSDCLLIERRFGADSYFKVERK